MIHEHANNLKPARACAALSALLLALPVLAHPVQTKLEMTVVSNAAFGNSVVSGDFAAAIEKIEALDAQRSGEFFVNNNLCVAYTKNGDLERAAKACDAAVREARADTRSRFALGGDQRHRAIALSNRGVLRAVTGDRENALRDLRKAVKLRARVSAPTRNLEYIESNELVPVSLLQTNR